MTVALRFGLPGSGDAEMGAFAMTGVAALVGMAALGVERTDPFAYPAFVVAGVCFGLSYVCLFEAYYRARVSVVSPLVATESLWGVVLSGLLLKAELVGRRLLLGSILVVSGGVLIGVFR